MCRSWFWGVLYVYIYACIYIYIMYIWAIHPTFRSLSQQVHIGGSFISLRFIHSMRVLHTFIAILLLENAERTPFATSLVKGS